MLNRHTLLKFEAPKSFMLLLGGKMDLSTTLIQYVIYSLHIRNKLVWQHNISERLIMCTLFCVIPHACKALRQEYAGHKIKCSWVQK